MSAQRKPKGITNAQAKYLASLQRKAGERYSGGGMTSRQASAEIQRLLGGDPTPYIRQAPVKKTRDRKYVTAVVIAPKAKARARARREATEALPRRVVRSRDRTAATPEQLHDLAVLARRAGEASPHVSHRGDAARELARLKRSALP